MDYILGRNVVDTLDSLQGLATDGDWTIFNAADKSQYATQGFTLDFSFIDSLIGEGGVDNFNFHDAVSMAGSIDGGAGYDTLDYGLYTTARNIVVTAASDTDGYSGHEAATLATGMAAGANGFTHINQILGGSAADVLNTIDADSTFTIDGVNGGTYVET